MNIQLTIAGKEHHMHIDERSMKFAYVMDIVNGWITSTVAHEVFANSVTLGKTVDEEGAF